MREWLARIITETIEEWNEADIQDALVLQPIDYACMSHCIITLRKITKDTFEIINKELSPHEWSMIGLLELENIYNNINWNLRDVGYGFVVNCTCEDVSSAPKNCWQVDEHESWLPWAQSKRLHKCNSPLDNGQTSHEILIYSTLPVKAYINYFTITINCNVSIASYICSWKPSNYII